MKRTVYATIQQASYMILPFSVIIKGVSTKKKNKTLSNYDMNVSSMHWNKTTTQKNFARKPTRIS
jgi:hypothetical protein